MIASIARRRFLQATAVSAASCGVASSRKVLAEDKQNLFEISLAQWSLNASFFSFLGRRGRNAEKLDPQDFAGIAKREFGINAVEYVNQFYMDAVRQPGYLEDLCKKAEDAGVRNVLIMCDREGNLGDPDLRRRITAVRNHIKWLEWAEALGCHSIRVNAASDPQLSYREQMEFAADGLRRLCEIADTYNLNVLVENHGGMSSHGRWLASVMELVDHPRCGTLPDFGNFSRVIRPTRNAPRGGQDDVARRGHGELEYDRYLGTYELMPYAKGVSAKAYAFDEQGNETTIDFRRIMGIVCDPQFDFDGYVGVEFERGDNPFEGIRKTKALLEKIRSELAST
jgi:hypothetical protein